MQLLRNTITRCSAPKLDELPTKIKTYIFVSLHSHRKHVNISYTVDAILSIVHLTLKFQLAYAAKFRAMKICILNEQTTGQFMTHLQRQTKDFCECSWLCLSYLSNILSDLSQYLILNSNLNLKMFSLSCALENYLEMMWKHTL